MSLLRFILLDIGRMAMDLSFNKLAGPATGPLVEGWIEWRIAMGFYILHMLKIWYGGLRDWSYSI